MGRIAGGSCEFPPKFTYHRVLVHPYVAAGQDIENHFRIPPGNDSNFFRQKWISQETCLVAVFQVSLVPRLLRIHYITVPCATLSCITSHHIRLYIYIPWHLINSPHIALHLIRLDHMMSLHYVSWHDIALAHTHTHAPTHAYPYWLTLLGLTSASGCGSQLAKFWGAAKACREQRKGSGREALWK